MPDRGGSGGSGDDCRTIDRPTERPTDRRVRRAGNLNQSVKPQKTSVASGRRTSSSSTVSRRPRKKRKPEGEASGKSKWNEGHQLREHTKRISSSSGSGNGGGSGSGSGNHDERGGR
ncbi:GL16510 [Drosophila persimilis]|uniref:GL16510 n=1 Tax=Drosophila persimilis TaxID=7234 RepID=B4GW79_DROPE|nr:GL16510 [Drosophila persimilis]